MTQDAEQTRGWFRHRRSGQVFEAEGYLYREALKNRDLEEVTGPGEKGDDSPSSKLVALRERVTGLGLEWTAGDSIEALNARLDDHAATLRGQAEQLGIRVMPNWKPETIQGKINEATAARTKAKAPAEGQ